MADASVNLLVHIAWSTRERRPQLTPDHDGELTDLLRRTADQLGVEIIAVGAAWDHVHLLVGWSLALPMGPAVETLKRRARVDSVRWADGYASCGVRAEEIPRVSRYLDLQKTHHEAGDLWARFERGIPRDDAEIPRSA
jgi:REP element-mobilizing transposase RayT